MKIPLFEHNRTAYRSALSLMAETGKAAVVHPTGTGKSYIAFKLAEEHTSCRICWLSPSDYIFKTQRENLHRTVPDCSLDNITFLTYSKLANLSPSEITALRPDFIVLDEFHRCGAEKWGEGVRRLLEAYPFAQKLGLSATPIRYLDSQRDMADELFEGHVASKTWARQW